MKSEEFAIELANIHKKFRIYGSPLSRLREWLTFGKLPTHYDFWALKNINLNVSKGEAIGIIGENGSGKSTMLKIIAGTTWPTIGDVKTIGRISALLELGAGFHPDFSGAQNIYISARLIGLTDDEIKERFDDIVRFAELGRFIHSPVRTYSSGMYVRLGFAVAASVSPEILIVDEALSVGDDYYQKKSIDRIKKFREDGITVLFVSHAMPHITRFCDRAIWLREGIIEAEGSAKDVVNEYQRYCYRHTYERLILAGKKDEAETLKPEEEPILEEQVWGSGKVKFTRVAILNGKGEETGSLDLGDDITIRQYYYAFEKIENPIFGLNIHTIQGVYIYGTNNHNIHPRKIDHIEGAGYIDFKIKNLILHKGKYFISVMVFDEPDDPYWQNPLDWHNQAYEFLVFSPSEAHGLVAFPGEWSKTHPEAECEMSGVPEQLDLENQWHFHFLDSGWYKLEKEDTGMAFSWSKDKGGFLLLQSPGKTVLELELRASHPDLKNNSVVVSVLMDDEKLGSIEINSIKWKKHKLNVPSVKKYQIRRLTLIPARIWKPEEQGLVGDKRSLGVGLHTAKFI